MFSECSEGAEMDGIGQEKKMFLKGKIMVFCIQKLERQDREKLVLIAWYSYCEAPNQTSLLCSLISELHSSKLGDRMVTFM